MIGGWSEREQRGNREQLEGLVFCPLRVRSPQVRFALAEEREVHEDSTPVQTWRYKKVYGKTLFFRHMGEMGSPHMGKKGVGMFYLLTLTHTKSRTAKVSPQK